MPRILPLPPDFESAETRSVLRRIRDRGEEPSPLYRTLAYAPKMLEAWANLAWPLRSQASVSRDLRELMIMRLAQINNSAYQWAYHWQPALASGLTEEKVRALSDWRRESVFDERERAVLSYAEQISELAVDNDSFVEMSRLFSIPELIELTLTASFYCCVGRVLQALQIDVDTVHERFLP